MRATGHLELMIEGLPTEVEVSYWYSYEVGYGVEIEECSLAGAPIMDIVEKNHELVTSLVSQAESDLELQASMAEAALEEKGDYLLEQRRDRLMEKRRDR